LFGWRIAGPTPDSDVLTVDDAATAVRTVVALLPETSAGARDK
jgi:hypothetical protein